MFGISLCLSACVIVVTSGPGRQTQLCLYCCSWTGSKCKQTEGHAASYLSCVTVGHHLFVCSVICPMRCGSAPGGGVSPVDQSQRRKEPQNKRTSKVRRCVPTQRSDDKKKNRKEIRWVRQAVNFTVHTDIEKITWWFRTDVKKCIF